MPKPMRSAMRTNRYDWI